MTKHRRPIWCAIDVRIPETDGQRKDCAMMDGATASNGTIWR